MKKALTIYVDDDAELKHLCGTFVCWKGEHNSVTMMNELIPNNATGLYLPFDKQEESWTKWLQEGAQDG